MKHFVLVGGNGFIGKEIQNCLGHSSFTILSHNPAQGHHYFNLHDQKTWTRLIEKSPTSVALLAWPGLDDYHHTSHLTKNLPNSIRLVEMLVDAGLKELVVAGTCYEYGVQNGCLSPATPTSPTTMYGIAKDALNKSLTSICIKNSVRYCWMRIFFPYGMKQRQNSLLPALISAAKENHSVFHIGNQDLIRDFIPVKEVAYRFVDLMQSDHASGVFNCGSGSPQSIRTFVEYLIREYNLDIKLIYNSVTPRKDEPFAFWADMSNWNKQIMSRRWLC